MAKIQAGGEQLAPPSGAGGLKQAGGGLGGTSAPPLPEGHPLPAPAPPPRERAQLWRASGEQGRLLCN